MYSKNVTLTGVEVTSARDYLEWKMFGPASGTPPSSLEVGSGRMAEETATLVYPTDFGGDDAQVSVENNLVTGTRNERSP